jgi:hypothetical protein
MMAADRGVGQPLVAVPAWLAPTRGNAPPGMLLRECSFLQETH